MKISNEFTVHTPIDKAWAVLTDLEGIAPCMPGAQLTGVDGDVYSGKVKIKVGPVISEFAGTAKFVEKDDTGYRAVIDAKGRDARSAGNAAAKITAQLRPDGDATVVSVDTDLKISGKLAQFGSGMIKEVSGKILGQFVDSLEAKIGAGDSVGTTSASAAPSAGPATSASSSADASPAPSPSPAAGASSAVGAAGAALAGPADTGVAVASDTSRNAAFPGESQPVIKAEPEVGGPAAAVENPVTDDNPASADSPASPATRGTPATSRAGVQTGEPEPLDLMDLAGGSIRRRLLPVAIGVAALVAAVVVYRVARR